MHAASVAAALPSRIMGVALFTPTSPRSVEKEIAAAISPVTDAVKTLLALPYLGDGLAFLMSYAMNGDQRLAAAPDVLVQSFYSILLYHQ